MLWPMVSLTELESGKHLTDPRRKLGSWSIKFNKLSINFSVPVRAIDRNKGSLLIT